MLKYLAVQITTRKRLEHGPSKTLVVGGKRKYLGVCHENVMTNHAFIIFSQYFDCNKIGRGSCEACFRVLANINSYPILSWGLFYLYLQ